jgi:hypothetical protein
LVDVFVSFYTKSIFEGCAIAKQTSTVGYLDPQTLATVGPVDLRARMVIEGLMTGMRR